MKKWTIDDARELYNINGWGTSYFGINDKVTSMSRLVKTITRLISAR